MTPPDRATLLQAGRLVDLMPQLDTTNVRIMNVELTEPFEM